MTLPMQPLELPLRGVDTDTPPLLMPEGYAPVLENFILHDDILRIRGPIQTHSALTLNAAHSSIFAGVWHYGTQSLVSTVSPHAVNYREPWTSFFLDVSIGNLANPIVRHDLIDWTNMTISSTTAGLTATNIIGGRGARIGTKVYGLGYKFGAETNPYESSNKGAIVLSGRTFLSWDGSSTAPTAYTNAPKSGQDVLTYLNRIWVVGGVAAGGSTFEPNVLFFSDQGGPTADTTAMWQDDATGLINRITVESDNPNDFCVAAARLGQTLVVFKRHSVHLLSGYSASTFTLRPVSQDIGCVDQRSIVEYEDCVYFMGERGYYKFDGTKLELVSNTLHRSLATATSYSVGANARHGTRVQAAKLNNDYILLTIYPQDISSGNLYTAPTIIGASSWCGLLHVPTGRWTTFSAGGEIPNAVGNLPNDTAWAAFGSRIYKLTNITSPELVTSSLLGYDARAANTAINAQWKSRRVSHAPYGESSQLHRLLVDYLYSAGSGTSPSNGWNTQILDSSGTAILNNDLALTSAGIPVRYVADVFNEGKDFQVFFSSNTTTTNGNATEQEIYGVGLEYQSTQNRHTR